MKTIGLIGGTTWVSTLEYYKLFNQKTHKILGKNHSARVILYSVDFEDVLRFKAEGRDDALKKMKLEASNAVDYAGADCRLPRANTMHMKAVFIADRISIPLFNTTDIHAEAAVRFALGNEYPENDGIE